MIADLSIRQRGTTTVEFAIVGVVLFTVLLGIIEFGRALFVWNSLGEVTRRAARVAAVCPVNHSAIARVAIFSDPAGDGDSSIVGNLTTDNISIEYLDKKGVLLPDPTADFRNISYVRSQIIGYQHTFLIPFVAGALTFDVPRFVTTIPRESLGIPREGVSPICFGTET